MTDQLHAPAALPLGEEPQFPLDKRLGEPRNCSGRRKEENNLGPSGTRTPSPLRPVRSQSLYRLRYPCSPINSCNVIKFQFIDNRGPLETQYRHAFNIGGLKSCQ
jgi:hypothetical protein